MFTCYSAVPNKRSATLNFWPNFPTATFPLCIAYIEFLEINFREIIIFNSQDIFH